MSIHDCPAELLDAFVEACFYCCERIDLRQLRQVNRELCALATPWTFYTTDVTSELGCARGIARMMDEGQLARYVRKIVFRSVQYHTDRSDLHIIDDAESEARGHLRRIFSHLEEFETLRSLELYFYPESDLRCETIALTAQATPYIPNPTRYYAMENLLMLSLTNSTRPASLTSLTLANLLPLTTPIHVSQGFRRLLSSLKHLTLSFHGLIMLGEMSDVFWELFWSICVIPVFLLPSQTTLTSLSITSDQPIGEDIDFTRHLAEVHFPHLQRLVLNGITFNTHGHLDTFILSHGPSLKTLELNSCAIYRPHHGVQRRWSDMLRELETGLDGLVDLKVLLRTGWGLGNMEISDLPRLTYTCSLGGFGYPRDLDWRPGPMESNILAEDGMALARLFMVVAARRARLPEP